MREQKSLPALPGRHAWWLVGAFGAAFAAGCATGVDVTDGELSEICSEDGASCGAVANAGGSAGNTTSGGAGNSPGGSANGGTFSGGSGGNGIPVNTGGSNVAGGSNTAGSSGSASGTAGTGGTPAQLADGDCLAQSDVVILYRDRKSGETPTNEPSMVLSVQNNGPAFDIGDLTIRYWFTADGATNFTSNVDYAAFDGQQNLTGSVQVTFGQELGSNYAELGFSTTGSVGAAGVREVQLRFHADGYTDLDQTNDFSFLPGATAATANPNITPYVSGEQVGGCVPSN